MTHTTHPSPYRLSTDPPPTVPATVSLAAAVLVPLVVLAALHPGGVTTAGAVLVGYLAGRRR